MSRVILGLIVILAVSAVSAYQSDGKAYRDFQVYCQSKITWKQDAQKACDLLLEGKEII